MEGMFEHIKGVKSVTPGYAGGTARNANYPAVSSETTSHANPCGSSMIRDRSYTDLLGVFFTVAHDPTQ
jgi:peptide-methionine (S)-S-oxide reductase